MTYPGWRPIDLVKGLKTWWKDENKNMFVPFWIMKMLKKMCNELFIQLAGDNTGWSALFFFVFVLFILPSKLPLTQGVVFSATVPQQPLSDFWSLSLACVPFYPNKWSVTPHDWLNTQGSRSKLGQTFLITSPPRQWYSPPNFSLMNLQCGGAWAANQR